MPVSADEQLAPGSSRQGEGGEFGAALDGPADPPPLEDVSSAPLASALTPALLPTGMDENPSGLLSLSSDGGADKGDKGDEGLLLLSGLKS